MTTKLKVTAIAAATPAKKRGRPLGSTSKKTKAKKAAAKGAGGMDMVSARRLSGVMSMARDMMMLSGVNSSMSDTLEAYADGSIKLVRDGSGVKFERRAPS